jgi:hypothetical protein
VLQFGTVGPDRAVLQFGKVGPDRAVLQFGKVGLSGIIFFFPIPLEKLG